MQTKLRQQVEALKKPRDAESSSAPHPPPSRRKSKVGEEASKVEKTTGGGTDDISRKANSPTVFENASTFPFGNFIQWRIKPIFAGGGGSPTKDQRRPTEIAPADGEKEKTKDDSQPKPKVQATEKKKP